MFRWEEISPLRRESCSENIGSGTSFMGKHCMDIAHSNLVCPDEVWRSPLRQGIALPYTDGVEACDDLFPECKEFVAISGAEAKLCVVEATIDTKVFQAFIKRV